MCGGCFRQGKGERLRPPSIIAATVDRLFSSRREHELMTVCKRACDKPTLVPSLNPFHRMELEYHPKPTRAVTHAELLRFVKAADEQGDASIGLAAMIEDG